MKPVVLTYNEDTDEILRNILQNCGEFVRKDLIKTYPVATAFTKILRKL